MSNRPNGTAQNAVWSFRNQLLAGLVLALACLAVYRPALDRVFVADQIWYLAELNGNTSLAAGLHFYDYAATRRYWKGDDALFRPLSLIWLAVGNSLFSYRHAWWNAANVGLHALVVFMLYRLLLTVRPSMFALPAAMLFAVMKPPLELVIWNHLGGYLLACGFLAIALRSYALRIFHPHQGKSWSNAAVYIAAFTAAELCHEAMVPVCFIAGCFVLSAEWGGKKRSVFKNALALFSPVLIFSLLYLWHALRVARLTYVDRPDVAGMFDPANVLSVIPRTVAVAWRWTAEVIFPSALTFGAAPFMRLSKSFAFSLYSGAQLFNLALFLSAAALLVTLLSPKYLRRNLRFILLMPAACFAYVGIICLGRGQGDVLATTYYLYFFCFIVVVFAYSIVDFGRLRAPGMVSAWVFLAAMILFQAVGTRRMTRDIGFINQRSSAYLTSIGRFVRSHRDEPGFTFRVQAAPADLDPEITLVEGYPDDPKAQVHTLPLSQILFAPYYDPKAARYVLDTAGSIVSRQGG